MPVACSCSDFSFHWGFLRETAWKALTPDFPSRVLSLADPAHHWIRQFPCLDLPPARFRGFAALFDCAPGIILMHVLCAQRKLLQLEYRAAQEQLVEALMVLPFAEECLEPHAKPKWPLSVFDVHSNYIRFYRAMSYYHETAELLEDLLWQPTRTCVEDMGCEGLPDHFCSRLHRCVPRHGCPRNAEECPLGERCTALSSYGDGCSLQLSPLCVQHGELQAFHPHSACLSAAEFPHMIKACSEMGTTLYPLKWSSSPYASYRDRIQGGSALAQPKDAFILPVTLRLRSPWHMLHSLVPAYAQSHMDERYGLAKLAGDFDLLIVDQDLDKDTHIWQQVFRNASGDSMGGLDFLLRLISHRPYKLLAQAEGCYERAVWGHELMLYSGGGWTSELHMAGFVRAAWRLDGRARRDSKDAPRLLLVERRNGTSWGRWIDNFPDVQSTAQSWANEHEDLLGGVEAADLADFSWPEQLRMAARMRLLFGAHGDGLSWSVFMGPGSAVLEAVPARGAGFQACAEGANANPFGIFGGVARLAEVAHLCFLNEASKVSTFQPDQKDLFQWGWRQLNLHIDLAKFREYLALAADLVAGSAEKVSGHLPFLLHQSPELDVFLCMAGLRGAPVSFVARSAIIAKRCAWQVASWQRSMAEDSFE
ncbi:unnamed protein product, partial [Effrenium voratum]